MSEHTPVSPCTGVYFDFAHSERMIDFASRRQNRAVSLFHSATTGERNWFNEQSRRYRAGLRRLRRARLDPVALDAELAEHFSAYSTRVALATSTIARHSPHPSVSDVRTLADQINIYRPAVVVSTTYTSSGSGTRATHAFSRVDFARQLGVADYLNCLGSAPFNDFSLAGASGRDGAIKHVCRKFVAGQSFAYAADIQKAFNSVGPDYLDGLIHIPDWMRRNILLPSPSEALHACFSPKAPCGLPQGSVCSPSAMSMVLGNSLRLLAEDGLDFSHYVDDVWAGAQSRPELEHLHQSLEEELLRVGRGGLRLAKVQMVNLFEGEHLDLLGYRITGDKKRNCFVCPSPSAWQKARERCFEKLSMAHLDHPITDLPYLQDMALDYFLNWGASQASWNADPTLKERQCAFAALEGFDEFCMSQGLRIS